MVRLLSKVEVLALHDWALEMFGGSPGIRDEGMLDSALAQPEAGFGGVELHPTLVAKAAALGFSLLKNHAFVDGNKRVAAWSMETFLSVNGCRLVADDAEFEAVILKTAGGEMSKNEFFAGAARRTVPL